MTIKPLSGLSDSPPEEIDDPILSELYDYWSALRTTDAAPLRSALEPTDIPHLLPYVILAECYDAGRVIKFRLTGSDIAFAPGSDLTGRYLHERGPMTPYLQHLCELYCAGANCIEGVYSAFSYGYSGEHGPKQVNRIFLPLRGYADIPSMLLVGQVRDKSTPSAKPIWLTDPTEITPLKLFAIGPATAPSG